MRFKGIAALFTCLLTLLLIVVYWVHKNYAQQKNFVVIGTGSMTGIYYPIGSNICRFLSKNYKDNLICSIASTTGSIYNLNSIRTKSLDIGIVQSDWEYTAYNGEETKKKSNVLPPMKNLRLLASLHKEYFTILARKDANINNINDLKGKRINIGAPGTGIRGAMLKLMDINGWTIKDFALVSELKSSEQAQALCDNKVDVIADFIGHPNAAMQEATIACDAVLIPLDDFTISQLHNKYPYYHSGNIPGNLYRNNKPTIQTVFVRAALLTTTDLEEEIAYKIVSSIITNFDELKNCNGSLRRLTKKDLLEEDGVPLHEGAKKYYQSINLE